MQVLVLSIALLSVGVKAGVDLVGAHQKCDDIGPAGDDLIQTLIDVERQITVDTAIEQLVAHRLRAGMQAADVVRAELPRGDAISGAHH